MKNFSPFEEVLIESILGLKPDSHVITKSYIEPYLTVEKARITNEDKCISSDFISSYFAVLQRCTKEVFLLHPNNVIIFTGGDLGDNLCRKILRWYKTREFFSEPNKYRKFAIPIVEDGHWYLILMNRDARCIEICDSLKRGRNYERSIEFAKIFLHTLIGSEQDLGELHLWKVYKPYKSYWNLIEQQEDGSSCGVFLLLFARYICMKKKFDFDQSHIMYFRKLLLLEVYYALIPYESTSLEENYWDIVNSSRSMLKMKKKFPKTYVDGYLAKNWYRIELPLSQHLSITTTAESNVWDILGKRIEDKYMNQKISALDALQKETSNLNVKQALNSLGYISYRLDNAYTKYKQEDSYDLIRIIGTEIFDLKNITLSNNLRISFKKQEEDYTQQNDVIDYLVFVKYNCKNVEEFLTDKLGWFPVGEIWKVINGNTAKAKQASKKLEKLFPKRSTGTMVQILFKMTVDSFFEQFIRKTTTKKCQKERKEKILKIKEERKDVQ